VERAAAAVGALAERELQAFLGVDEVGDHLLG
jgi:hypothetical protein